MCARTVYNSIYRTRRDCWLATWEIHYRAVWALLWKTFQIYQQPRKQNYTTKQKLKQRNKITIINRFIWQWNIISKRYQHKSLVRNKERRTRNFTEKQWKKKKEGTRCEWLRTYRSASGPERRVVSLVGGGPGRAGSEGVRGVCSPTLSR